MPSLVKFALDQVIVNVAVILRDGASTVQEHQAWSTTFARNHISSGLLLFAKNYMGYEPVWNPSVPDLTA